MPELIIKYKNPRVKEALIDISKYLDYSIVPSQEKKKIRAKLTKEDILLKQIENGLLDVKKIKKGTVKGMTVKEMLNDK